jgi:hypothetical protein
MKLQSPQQGSVAVVHRAAIVTAFIGGSLMPVPRVNAVRHFLFAGWSQLIRLRHLIRDGSLDVAPAGTPDDIFINFFSSPATVLKAKGLNRVSAASARRR